MDIEAIIIAMLPSLLVGLVLAHFNQKQKKRDEEHRIEVEAKRKESHLLMNMVFATAKLSFAVAMAHKRGSPNGEIEEGIDAYKAAKAEYLDFLNEQANNHLIH